MKMHEIAEGADCTGIIIGEAIRVLAPDVVDVSSGVESSPGMKHPESVQRFVTAVRAAMESGR